MGIRAKSIFLHDGRADDIPTAISLHDGQRKAAAEAFQALSGSQQDELMNFLDTCDALRKWPMRMPLSLITALECSGWLSTIKAVNRRLSTAAQVSTG
jgi:hypothetical protein